MRQVFDGYAGGAYLDQVIASAGCSRGTVSNYLNELERETRVSIVRGHWKAVKTDGERETGLRRASLHDIHSFRVTWITLALAAGVPLELVQRVTGHRTVAIVLKHYFRPRREDFRQVLTKAMPRILGEGTPRPASSANLRKIFQGMTASAWKDVQAELLTLLAQA